jgi:protein-S-isoprenylcysteine O-methyltransferase Ste14
MIWVASISFGVAVFCFVDGFVTEYRQSRWTGKPGEPNAIVATLPNAVQAAILVGLGLFALPIPWWITPIGAVASLMVFGYLIMNASAAPKSPERNNETRL